jgi:hypothetical protein
MTALIDGAKRDISVAKAASLLARSDVDVEGLGLGTYRDDARGARPFIVAIARFDTSGQGHRQGCTQRHCKNEARQRPLGAMNNSLHLFAPPAARSLNPTEGLNHPQY